MKKSRTPLIVLAFVVVIAVCAALVVVYKKQSDESEEQLNAQVEAYNSGGIEAVEGLADETEAATEEETEDTEETEETEEVEEETEASEEAAEEESDLSFYEKLAAGEDVSILILGDEIGASESVSESEGWSAQLVEYLEETYLESSGSEIAVTNLSEEGADSADGYDLVTEHEGSYDLVILCYGSYDDDDEIALNYEMLLRAVIQKYDCSVLSILESSHINEMLEIYDHYSTSTYTDKMDTIISLCEHYGVQLADTVYAFYKSPSSYNSLASQSVPNEKGYALYYETIRDLIDENVTMATGKVQLADPVDDDVTAYDLVTEEE